MHGNIVNGYLKFDAIISQIKYDITLIEHDSNVGTLLSL